MKTLIIYSSRYGLTAEAVAELALKLGGETDRMDITGTDRPDLNRYERVIIGSSIYMGQVDKKLRQWVQSEQESLRTKKLGLFLCCGLPENCSTYLEQAYGSDLVSQAATVCLGGELKMEGMRWLDRKIATMMTRMAKKEGKPMPERQFENIGGFVERLC